MNKNIGNVDKYLRVILGVIIVLLGVVFKNWWGLIGIILLGTGIIGICPIYSVLKISTKKK